MVYESCMFMCMSLSDLTLFRVVQHCSGTFHGAMGRQEKMCHHINLLKNNNLTRLCELYANHTKDKYLQVPVNESVTNVFTPPVTST